MEIEPSADGLCLHLKIDAELTAADTDALLRKLALARARMTPAVPHSTEPLESSGAPVLVEDLPALSIRARSGGGFRLWLRHRGFNWLAYQIDDRVAAGLSNFIRKHIGDGPDVDLINTEPVGRH